MPSGGSNKINEIGRRYGSLVVVAPAPSSAYKSTRWRVLCDCGTTKVVTRNALHSKTRVKSCGCLWLSAIRAKLVSHGMSGTKIYQLWATMMARCYRKTAQRYEYYGARGIRVSRSWHKFENFYRDMGEKPAGKSLDRIDNNGNYCKENCRWATQKEQVNNARPRRRKRTK